MPGGLLSHWCQIIFCFCGINISKKNWDIKTKQSCSIQMFSIISALGGAGLFIKLQSEDDLGGKAKTNIKVEPSSFSFRWKGISESFRQPGTDGGQQEFHTDPNRGSQTLDSLSQRHNFHTVQPHGETLCGRLDVDTSFHRGELYVNVLTTHCCNSERLFVLQRCCRSVWWETDVGTGSCNVLHFSDKPHWCLELWKMNLNTKICLKRHKNRVKWFPHLINLYFINNKVM